MMKCIRSNHVSITLSLVDTQASEIICFTRCGIRSEQLCQYIKLLN